ncbi:sterol desaturase family protein [bacterium]|nr:sterol desaturase family protein [bacterium]
MDLIKNIVDSLYNNILAEWWLWVLILISIIIPLIPGINPKKQNLKVFASKNFFVDALYGLFDLLHFWHYFVIVPTSVFVGKFLSDNFIFLKIDYVSQMPIWIQLIILFTVMDLSVYALHRFQHSNIYTWQFHKTHHSQEVITSLTTFRKTILDRLFELIILTIPAFILSVDYSYPIYIVVFTTFHQLFIHSNTGHKLGYIGNFIVSPAFHEIHHSVALSHRDSNFGGVLTVWDKLFNTYVEPTNNLKFGIDDEKIPENYFYQIFVPLIGFYKILFKKPKN